MKITERKLAELKYEEEAVREALEAARWATGMGVEELEQYVGEAIEILLTRKTRGLSLKARSIAAGVAPRYTAVVANAARSMAMVIPYPEACEIYRALLTHKLYNMYIEAGLSRDRAQRRAIEEAERISGEVCTEIPREVEEALEKARRLYYKGKALAKTGPKGRKKALRYFRYAFNTVRGVNIPEVYYILVVYLAELVRKGV